MRLYSCFLQQLSWLFPPQEDLSALNCVLQCEPLSQAQDVEVRLEGVLLAGHQEETYRVFAWQAHAGALMEVTLLQRGRFAKVWRGCWDGQQGLCHGGTLAVEVFLEQEVVAPSSAPPPPLPLPRADVLVAANGHQPAPRADVFATATSHQPDVAPGASLPHDPLPPLPTVRFGDETLVVLAGGQPLAALPETPLSALSSPPAGDVREGPEEEEDLWTQAAEATRQSFPDEEESIEDEVWDEEEEREDVDEEAWGEEEEAEEDADEEAEEELSVEEAEPAEERGLPEPVPSSVQIATFHAGQGVSFSALLELLGRMPPGTVVVDLRLHLKRRGGEQGVFSKEQLRARFGALYWDRGALIQRTLQHTDGRWRTVITNLDDPQGVLSWLPSLRRGMCMVFLDERAVYAESLRAAVVGYLRTQQQQLPALTVLSEG